MNNLSFLFLSQEEVIKCGGLDMAATLKDVETATIMAYRGDAIEATTSSLFWDAPKDRRNLQIGYPGSKRVNIHAAYLRGTSEMVGIKNIPSNPENPAKYQTPRASGFITLISSETGYPYSLMDAAIISGMRTGALAGIGVKYLSPSKKCTIGMVGAGPINRAALMAAKESKINIGIVKIFDLNSERSSNFAKELKGQLNLDIRVVGSAEEAVRESDIVMPATTVNVPEQAYIQFDWLRPGCLLIDLSLWDEELEVFLNANKLVVNSLLALERGNITPGSLITAGHLTRDRFIDLGGIIEGELKGRENETEIIVYFARGMAIYDVINAFRIFNNAKEKDIGKNLTLWEKPYWY